MTRNSIFASHLFCRERFATGYWSIKPVCISPGRSVNMISSLLVLEIRFKSLLENFKTNRKERNLNILDSRSRFLLSSVSVIILLIFSIFRCWWKNVEKFYHKYFRKIWVRFQPFRSQAMQTSKCSCFSSTFKEVFLGIVEWKYLILFSLQ